MIHMSADRPTTTSEILGVSKRSKIQFQFPEIKIRSYLIGRYAPFNIPAQNIEDSIANLRQTSSRSEGTDVSFRRLDHNPFCPRHIFLIFNLYVRSPLGFIL